MAADQEWKEEEETKLKRFDNDDDASEFRLLMIGKGIKAAGAAFTGGQYNLGVLLPSTWAEEAVDMRMHHFNLFNVRDPANVEFAKHLAVRIGALMGCPPPFRQFGACFEWKETGEAGVTLAWGSGKVPKLSVGLRMNPFYQSFFMPRLAMTGAIVVPEVRMSLARLESFRPHRFDPSIILTCSPILNHGQSLFLPPFAICSDLMGDNFLRPQWTLPCIALVEPRGERFEIVHQPILRLEKVESLGQWNYLSILDGRGWRVPLGMESRVWIDLTSF